MKKPASKLVLARETIRHISDLQLVRGGVAPSNGECKTTYTWICTFFTCAGTAVR